MFDNTVLRRIFDPREMKQEITKENHNELHNEWAYSITAMKTRMIWERRVARMGKMTNAFKWLSENIDGRIT
jgi:hypothetical protein